MYNSPDLKASLDTLSGLSSSWHKYFPKRLSETTACDVKDTREGKDLI